VLKMYERIRNLREDKETSYTKTCWSIIKNLTNWI